MPELGREKPGLVLPGLGLFTLALGLRLLHLWQIRDAPYTELLLGDAASYDRWAGAIAAGDWLGREVFYQAPLYPYLLGLVYTIFGPEPQIVRLLQALLGACSCLLLAGAARRFLNVSARVGLVAGLVLAIYPPALFFESRIDKSALDLFLVCLTLRLIAALASNPRPLLGWSSGATLGALALTRENALALIAAVALWLGFLCFHRRSVSTRLLLLFAAGLLTVLAPVALRNAWVGGGLHLTTSQFGPNLYIGNNPEANGTYRPLRHGQGSWLHERRDATEIAEQAEGRVLSASEVSRYWTRRALAYVVSAPLDWLKLKLTTFRLTWNGVEIGDAEDPYTQAERSTLLRRLGALLHFGSLAPLALLGFWITWSRRERLWPLYLMGAAYVLSLALFYVVGRYRYPLVPLLAIFAAAALAGFRDWWREKPRRVTLPCLALTALFTLFCNWPMLGKDAMRAVTQLNIASGYADRGEPERAIPHLERAVMLRPDFDIAHYNLGNLLRGVGRDHEAIEHYRRAVEIAPDYFEAYNNWGNVLLNLHRLDEAAALFRRVLVIEPDSVPAHYSLGETLRLAGDVAGAIEQYRLALSNLPDHEPSRRRLAQLDAAGRMGSDSVGQ